jgi:hypothetical protein
MSNYPADLVRIRSRFRASSLGLAAMLTSEVRS